MTNTPTPARPALDAMAEEIERLLTWAGPQPWAVVEYGDEDSTSLAIHSSDEIRVCFMATPGSNGDEAKIATTADLIVYLKNNAPAICAAIRSLADMRGALQDVAAERKRQVEALEILDRLIVQMDKPAQIDLDNKYLRNAILHTKNDLSVLASVVRHLIAPVAPTKRKAKK